MAAVSLSQFLMLYGWFPLAVVLILLLLIARFYERSSGERTYFQLFIVPIVLFGIGTTRYSSVNRIAGDWLGDLLMGAGGIVLLVLCLLLYHLMTRDR